MEKDSFEKLLRSKVLQAESALNQSLDKEKVWNAIQKRKPPIHKFYYAAAAVVFCIGLVSLIYVKENQTMSSLAKLKIKEKPVHTNLPKQQESQAGIIIQKTHFSVKADLNKKISVAKEEEQITLISEASRSKGLMAIDIPSVGEVMASLPKSDNAVNKAEAMHTMAIVPEFTVQFKRGVSVSKEINENSIITNLKKFKLKRDTTYFANAIEKQPTKIRLTYKKEN